jgi:hypothetical protein
MAKIQVSAVAEILKKHKLKPALLREIVEEMNALTLVSESDVQPPAPKRQFVVILSDATGLISKRIDARNLVGWVVQIPENASPFSTMERVFKGAYDFNASKKGRLLPVKSVGEAIECASAKYFSEAELKVKTKLPVAIIVTDNVLPREYAEAEPATPDEAPDGLRRTVKIGGKVVFDSHAPVHAATA